MRNIWKKVVEISTKPLPDNVCYALGHMKPPCYMCWTCVGMAIFLIVGVILLVGLLG